MIAVMFSIPKLNNISVTKILCIGILKNCELKQAKYSVWFKENKWVFELKQATYTAWFTKKQMNTWAETSQYSVWFTENKWVCELKQTYILYDLQKTNEYVVQNPFGCVCYKDEWSCHILGSGY